MELQEFTDDRVRFQANGSRVGANKSAAKNTLRPVRHVVSLQSLQQGQLDLRLVRDGGERYLLSLTLQAESSTETFIHDTPRRPRHTASGNHDFRELVERLLEPSSGPFRWNGPKIVVEGLT
jgi:hypothetical protein